MNSELRTSLIEKVVFPTLSAVLSSVIIGLVLSVLINSKMERWKMVSSLQINREQEAQVKTYDSYEAASQALANYYWRTGSSKAECYSKLEQFASDVSAQAAYMPEELEMTYRFLDYEMIIGARLVTKDIAGTISKAEIARAEKSKDASMAAEDMLRQYMRAWDSGEAAKAGRILHTYFEKYVKTGLDEADQYSTKVLNEESPVKSESSIK